MIKSKYSWRCHRKIMAIKTGPRTKTYRKSREYVCTELIYFKPIGRFNNLILNRHNLSKLQDITIIVFHVRSLSAEFFFYFYTIFIQCRKLFIKNSNRLVVLQMIIQEKKIERRKQISLLWIFWILLTGLQDLHLDFLKDEDINKKWPRFWEFRHSP